MDIVIKSTIYHLMMVSTVYWMLDVRSKPCSMAQSCRDILMKDVPASSITVCLKCILKCLCVSEICEAEGL